MKHLSVKEIIITTNHELCIILPLKFVNQYWIKIVELNYMPVPANGMKCEKVE
jgi:hypothetical protein